MKLKLNETILQIIKTIYHKKKNTLELGTLTW